MTRSKENATILFLENPIFGDAAETGTNFAILDLKVKGSKLMV